MPCNKISSPVFPTIKKRGAQILLQGDIYMHKECNINHNKMPVKYYIFYHCQKQEWYQIGWEVIEEFLLICQSFNIYLCSLCALFVESLSSSCSIHSQSLSQSTFHFFSKWHSNTLSRVPICFPMTDTSVADGTNGPLYISWIDEGNFQEPDCIGRNGCSGGVTVTGNNFD